MPGTTTVHTAMWRPSRLRHWLAVLTYPVFLVLNRPFLGWFADLTYDFALRCSGIAVTFPGKGGLTRSEENFLRRHRDRFQNGILFDIGANHGSYALYLSRLAAGAKIYAFEPHPATFAFLDKRMENVGSVEVVNAAMADKPGEMKLYDFRSEDGSTQASLSASAVALYSADLVEHTVNCTTVDAFMEKFGLKRIDLLKIDTEGHDLSVMRGAAKVLRQGLIGMIQFEFIPANIATGVTMHAIFEALSGYRIGRMCLNGSVRWLDPYDVKRCEIYVTQNLIAVPLGHSL